MPQTHKAELHAEFTPLFDDFSGRSIVEKGSFLMAITALEAGLEVIFARSQARVGAKLDFYRQEFGVPSFFVVRDPKTAHAPVFWAGTCPLETISAKKLRNANHKAETKRCLQAAGVLTPFGGMVDARHLEVLDAFRRARIGRVVVKPVGGSRSKGILTDVPLDVAAAHIRSLPKKSFIVEQPIQGREFRVYVARNRSIGTYERIAAHVVGDGRRSVEALIAAENDWRTGHPEFATRFIDVEKAAYRLSLDGLTPEHVPAEKERVWLTVTSTTTTGTVFSQVDDPPADLVETAIRATRAMGLKVSGIDLRLDAAGRPFVLEGNIRPGIAAPSLPRHLPGWDPTVARSILMQGFPKATWSGRTVRRFEFNALEAALMAPGGRGIVRAAEYAEMG